MTIMSVLFCPSKNLEKFTTENLEEDLGDLEESDRSLPDMERI